MRRTRMGWTQLLLSLGCLGGCGGEDLSVGEEAIDHGGSDRCFGDRIECEPSRAPLWTVDTRDLDDLGDIPVDYVWTWSHPDIRASIRQDPRSFGGVQMVVHEDGTVTAAAVWHDASDPIVRALAVGMDADGSERWTYALPADGAGGASPRLFLATDGGGGAVVGSSMPHDTSDGGLREDRVFVQIDADGEGQLLFRDEQPSLQMALHPDGLVTVDLPPAQRVMEGNPIPPLETSLWSREGRLVWRQTSVLPNVVPNGGLAPALLIDADADVFVMGEADLGREISQLDRDGNVRTLSLTGHPINRLSGNGKLSIDSSGRLIMLFDGYAVVRWTAGSVSYRGDVMGRAPSEFHSPPALGLAADAHDRIYVATSIGNPPNTRFAIDRISEDLTSRETFLLPDESDVLLGPLRASDDATAGPGRPDAITGLAIGPFGEVYISTTVGVARVDLPE